MVTAGAPLQVVFFGTPEFAVPTLRALHDSRHSVVGVVTQPDRARGRGHKSHPGPVKQLAEASGLPLLQPARLRDEAFLAALRGFGADLGVVAAYGRILTDEVLQIPRLGLINVHASLLPKYRGAAPIHRAVMAGDAETGVTIMRVVKALDAGPTILKVVHPIGDDDTSADVERAVAGLGAQTLVDVVDLMAAGRAVEVPQDNAQATYAPKIERADGIVEWSRSAREIHNQIRGLHPWPHAHSDLEGERTILLQSAVENETGGGETVPGTVFEAHGDRLVVGTGRGLLRVLMLQREGRRPVSAREFLAGRHVAPGARFTRSDPA
jgi:methionyl-tRNA formyltransferase